MKVILLLSLIIGYSFAQPPCVPHAFLGEGVVIIPGIAACSVDDEQKMAKQHFWGKGQAHIMVTPKSEDIYILNKKFSEGTIKRDDFFITAKISHNDLKYDSFIDVLQKIKNNVRTIDLLLLNAPLPIVHIVYQSLYSEPQGIKAFGVCNHSISELRILKELGIKIDAYQNESNVFNYNKNLIHYCSKEKIVVMSHNPLPQAIDKSAQLGDLSLKYKMSPYSVALSWLLHRNIVAIVPSPINFLLEIKHLKSQDIFLIDNLAASKY